MVFKGSALLNLQYKYEHCTIRHMWTSEKPFKTGAWIT